MGRRRLEIAEQFVAMLHGGPPHHYRVVRDPVPADARIVGVDWRDTGILVLILESDAWAGPADGADPPTIEPLFVAIRPEVPRCGD